MRSGIKYAFEDFKCINVVIQYCPFILFYFEEEEKCQHFCWFYQIKCAHTQTHRIHNLKRLNESTLNSY